MIRNIFIVAALLVPGIARAEFVSKKSSDVRAQPTKPASVDTLTVDGMLSKINNRYMTGLQRCYVKGLAQDPSLRGKVDVVFTINPWGRVSGAATGIAPKVDSCLSNQLSTWRFPAPRDASDKPTQASFKISLMLRQ
jgi:hypothetical protein